MNTVDLRSDTFTLPDDAMRDVIRNAEVGNSGFGEDPSVNQLQESGITWLLSAQVEDSGQRLPILHALE